MYSTPYYTYGSTANGLVLEPTALVYTVNVEIFDARKFRALWTGPIILNFRAH